MNSDKSELCYIKNNIIIKLINDVNGNIRNNNNNKIYNIKGIYNIK
jgi:hypothetical protein